MKEEGTGGKGRRGARRGKRKVGDWKGEG